MNQKQQKYYYDKLNEYEFISYSNSVLTFRHSGPLDRGTRLMEADRSLPFLQKFLTSPNCPVKKITIDRCTILTRGILTILKENKTVTELNITYCTLGDSKHVLITVANFLKGNRTIQKLGLHLYMSSYMDNENDPQSTKLLQSLLGTAVTHLDLRQNFLDATILKVLKEVIPKLRLQSLDLGNNLKRKSTQDLENTVIFIVRKNIFLERLFVENISDDTMRKLNMNLNENKCIRRFFRIFLENYGPKRLFKMSQISEFMYNNHQIILKKLKERLYIMRKLKYRKVQTQIQISQETMDIFVPLAAYIGSYKIKTELENIAFMYLYPHDYKDVALKLSTRNHHYKNFFIETREALQTILQKIKNLPDIANVEINGRIKGIYSLWKKFKSKFRTNENETLDFDTIHDVIGFRIVISLDESFLGSKAQRKEREIFICKQIADLVCRFLNNDSNFKCKIKDYISHPKINGYQSLHIIICRNNQLLEIQIRTNWMHNNAESGLSAHCLYKGYTINNLPEPLYQTALMRYVNELMDAQTRQSIRDPKKPRLDIDVRRIINQYIPRNIEQGVDNFIPYLVNIGKCLDRKRNYEISDFVQGKNDVAYFEQNKDMIDPVVRKLTRYAEHHQYSVTKKKDPYSVLSIGKKQTRGRKRKTVQMIEN